uniref:Reverse transcriptase domain-containing protein n=1 Tax=Cannabis sativa TaxID=3483 RepID=A0A803NGT2_CANSA
MSRFMMIKKGDWRLTGCYGEPNRSLRHKTWILLKTLATKYDYPWCVIGDLNNVVSQEDKKGGNHYPSWLIEGFNNALSECNLCDLDLIGHPYTWEKGRGTASWVEVRLDRAVVNQKWIDTFISAKLFNLEFSSSDHSPILLSPYDPDVTFAKKRFRFENAWLREPLCTQIVSDCWEFSNSSSVTAKIESCGKALADWGQCYTGNFKSKIQQCKKEIKLWKKGRDAASITKFQAQNELFEIYANEKFLRRSKQLWLRDGDHNDEVITSYFDHLFCSSGVDTSEVINNIPATVTVTQNESLVAPVSSEEVRKALFQMHPDKSPGPDPNDTGFLSTLLEYCWTRYRPNEVLPKLISDNQSAFVPGRLITNNIMISYEIMHYLKRKRRGKEGYMAVSLDFSKAYDRVEWSFLKDMMLKMGFDTHWVHLILKCVTSVRYTILNSGREMGPIIPKRGIRQGDPLSSYLFLICAEGFSSLIKQFELSRRIRGCKVANRAPVISHMLFADDSYVYCRANENEASNVIQLLSIFENASGQTVNFDKSSLFFSSNTLPTVRSLICNVMGIKEANESSSYLGLPCLVGRNKNAILGFLKNKVQKRINQWESRFLSKAGKEILLKTVAQAFPSYAMSVFLLPLETCHGLESLMSKFWWQSSKNKQGVSWVSWKKMCKHKSFGGLGFRDFRNYNLALLGKQAWRLLTAQSSLVTKIYKARYFPNDNFLNANVGNNPSFIWKSIIETKDIIKAGARIRIGTGAITNILTDPWLPDLQQPYVTSFHPGLEGKTVASLMQINHRSWDVDVLSDLFNERDKDLIVGIPLSQHEAPDCWFWNREAAGFYSVKSSYRLLQGEESGAQTSDNFWKSFWQIKVPPKVLHFGWRAISGCLPTTTQLQTKHVNVPILCKFCNSERETIAHVLIDCNFARSCWNRSAISCISGNVTDFKNWFVNVILLLLNNDVVCQVLMVAWRFGMQETAFVETKDKFSCECSPFSKIES